MSGSKVAYYVPGMTLVGDHMSQLGVSLKKLKIPCIMLNIYQI